MLWVQIVLLIYLIIYIARIIEGPSIWNRLLCVNLVMTKIILMIVIYASMHDTGYFLDFAIIYAVCGFIGTIFLANFMSDRIISDKEQNKNQKENDTKFKFNIKSIKNIKIRRKKGGE